MVAEQFRASVLNSSRSSLEDPSSNPAWGMNVNMVLQLLLINNLQNYFGARPINTFFDSFFLLFLLFTFFVQKCEKKLFGTSVLRAQHPKVFKIYNNQISAMNIIQMVIVYIIDKIYQVCLNLPLVECQRP